MSDIQKIIILVLKKLWLIIPLSCLAAAGAWYYYSNYTVYFYEAHSSIYALTKNYSELSGKVNSDMLTVNRAMVKDYRELIKSVKVTSAVIEELGFKKTSPETLGNMIDIVSQNDSNVLQITIIDTNPDRAVAIADSVSRIFIKTVNELTNGNNLSILDTAKTTGYPINASYLKEMVIAFMFVFLMLTVIIYFLETFRRKLVTVEDTEALLKEPVIGIIPKMNIK